jgi:hypothetical protein
MLDLLQVIGFGDTMRLGKRKQLFIPSPLGNCHNAFVNADGTSLSRMI